MLLNIVAIGRC